MFDGTTREERHAYREQLREDAEKELREFEALYPEECKEAGDMPWRKLAIFARYYQLTADVLRF